MNGIVRRWRLVWRNNEVPWFMSWISTFISDVETVEFRGFGVRYCASAILCFVLWIDIRVRSAFVVLPTHTVTTSCVDHDSPLCDRDRIEISWLSSCTWLLVAYLFTCPGCTVQCSLCMYFVQVCPVLVAGYHRDSHRQKQ